MLPAYLYISNPGLGVDGQQADEPTRCIGDDLISCSANDRFALRVRQLDQFIIAGVELCSDGQFEKISVCAPLFKKQGEVSGVYVLVSSVRWQSIDDYMIIQSGTWLWEAII